MAEFTDEALKRIISLAHAEAGPQIAEGCNIPYSIVGGQLVSLKDFKYNEHSERPERIKTTVTVLSAQSFISYWREFADGDSRIFAWEPDLSVTGILDYHEAGDPDLDPVPPSRPRWGSHRLVLTLRKSEEWLAWENLNNKQMTQIAFAEHLEQWGASIVKPSPAAMMEVAHDLIGTEAVEFGAGVRNNDGSVSFRYTKSVSAAVGNGSVVVPGEFVLELPVFLVTAPVKVSALFRYRMKEGGLTVWYTLVQPQAAIRAAFNWTCNEIAQANNSVLIAGQVK